MKSLLNIAPGLLFALALMLLYRAHTELKYNYESLEWRMKNKTEQLDLVNATLWRRIDQNVQQTNSRSPLAHGPGRSKVTQ